MDSLLFRNVTLRGEPNRGRLFDVATAGNLIASVTEAVTGAPEPAQTGVRVIEGHGRLLTTAFYNLHCHAPMTLFRGMGGDLPLKRWLDECILPAEDKLTPERVYTGTLAAIAEMLRAGIVSFSDMYFFSEDSARAIVGTGIKANLSRSVVSFDPNADLTADARFLEGIRLFENWNGREDGRIRVDMGLHAVYSNIPRAAEYIATLAEKLGTGIQIHLSETEGENEQCLAKYGMTPTALFEKNGLFRVPVTAAHCVYLTDEDLSILATHGATVVHNPISNLKLGSGIMPLRHTLDSGVNVAIGTDGVASNNRLDVLGELQTALLLQKGVSRMPDSLCAPMMWDIGTVNGARAQGRPDAGRLEPGYRADLLLWDLSDIRNTPAPDADTALMYSARATDIRMTVADGRVLYEDGHLTTVDEEKVLFDLRRLAG